MKKENLDRMTVWFTRGQLQFIRQCAKRKNISQSMLLREVMEAFKMGFKK